MMTQELRRRCDDNDDNDDENNDAMMMSDDDDTWYDIMYCWLVPLCASSFTSNSTHSSLMLFFILVLNFVDCWVEICDCHRVEAWRPLRITSLIPPKLVALHLHIPIADEIHPHHYLIVEYLIWIVVDLFCWDMKREEKGREMSGDVKIKSKWYNINIIIISLIPAYHN